jgi:peptide/nickel transport system permease protein
MATYIVRRLLQGIVVLFLATFLIYSIILVTPGGPADQVNNLKQQQAAGQPINEELKRLLEEQYNLNLPYPVNYLVWLFDPRKTTELQQPNYEKGEYEPITVQRGIDIFGVIKGSGILTGDFGTSYFWAGEKVLKLMGDRIGNTISLAVLSILLSIIIALPLGIVSAVKQYSKLDYAVTTFSFVGIAMPSFWFGMMLYTFLGVLARSLHEQQGWTWLPFLPVGGVASGVEMEGNILNRLYHLMLPVTVLSLISIAGYSRFVRASMLEVLRQDYVRTAWAKGLSQRTVIVKHALRNALIPVITIITLNLPALFSGAIITETVFGYGGMGKLYYDSILAFDVSMIMGFLLIVTGLIILSNILADVLYAVADPRIRYS